MGPGTMLAIFLSASTVGATDSGFLKPQETAGPPRDDTFKAVKSHVGDLEERLASLEKESIGEVSAAKQKYQARLDRKMREIRRVEAQSDEIKAKIRATRDANRDLKAEAANVSALNAILRRDLQRLRFNITTAIEFTDIELNDSNTKLHMSSKLEVLDELNRRDEESSESQERDMRLHEVARAARRPIASLLGLAARRPHGEGSPEELIETLASAFDSLQEEQNRSKQMLDQAFRDQYEAAEAELRKQLDAQADLNATLAATEELRDRLRAAVAHLKKTNGKLQERAASMQSYMEQLSRNPVPSAAELQARKSARHMARLSQETVQRMQRAKKALQKADSDASKQKSRHVSIDEDIDAPDEAEQEIHGFLSWLRR